MVSRRQLIVWAYGKEVGQANSERDVGANQLCSGSLKSSVEFSLWARALCCFVIFGEWKWVLCQWCPVKTSVLREGTAVHLKGGDLLFF